MTPSRREFLWATATAGLGTALGATVRAAPRRSRVVLVRHTRVLRPDGTLDPTVLAGMLDRAVARLLGTGADAAAAWRLLIRPADTVGIKSNEWEPLPTPPALEAILTARVRRAGVPERRVAVADRRVLRDPVFRRCTALINVRPMRTHAWAGVGSLIKNYIMFVPRPWEHHPDGCADLGAIWHRPRVAGKTRLNVLVLLTPLFHGVGWHHFSPEYTWPYQGLVVSTDPVAADVTGLRILEARRRQHFGAPRPLAPEPKHIRLAGTRHGLGEVDPTRIELLALGPAAGRLI